MNPELSTRPTSSHSISIRLCAMRASRANAALGKASSPCAGPLNYVLRELDATSDGEVAFVHSLNHVTGALLSGHVNDLWVRWTACFRRFRVSGS